MKVSEILTSLTLFIAALYMILTAYESHKIYEDFMLLKTSYPLLEKERDHYKKLYKDSEPKCKERIQKAIKLEKEKRDAEDKINNTSSGFVTLPGRMQQ